MKCSNTNLAVPPDKSVNLLKIISRQCHKLVEVWTISKVI